MLVRSPYLPGANEQWMARAALEAQWLNEGRRELLLDDISAGMMAFDANLSERWRAARRMQRPLAAQSPREWVEAVVQEQMKQITGGLPLPPGFKL